MAGTVPVAGAMVCAGAPLPAAGMKGVPSGGTSPFKNSIFSLSSLDGLRGASAFAIGEEGDYYILATSTHAVINDSILIIRKRNPVTSASALSRKVWAFVSGLRPKEKIGEAQAVLFRRGWKEYDSWGDVAILAVSKEQLRSVFVPIEIYPHVYFRQPAIVISGYRDIIEKTRLFPGHQNGRRSDMHIAMFPGQGGDSGSPLLVEREGRWLAGGVLSCYIGAASFSFSNLSQMLSACRRQESHFALATDDKCIIDTVERFLTKTLVRWYPEADNSGDNPGDTILNLKLVLLAAAGIAGLEILTTSLGAPGAGLVCAMAGPLAAVGAQE
ncbi:MAG: hypothetical protein KJ880_05430, partial [Candidatus Omnitrophica bacterium]|nr:hypothetical protein [Candidatus Omnitrophota bacterium]